MRMMRTAAGLLLACAGVLVPLGADAAPRITAKSAVIMDAESGVVLWQRDGDRALPPASTTKVVSAILALESGRLGESMRVSSYAASTPASKLYLRTGQRMRLEHLVYAMLLNSANDASVVVAEGLAGSQASFGRQMTRRARDLGALHTAFVNPHGLTAPGHVASARDLATVFRYGLGVPRFRGILETQSIRVPVQSSKSRSFNLRSHNRLLRGYRYQVIGKTGYTRAAGRCFVGSAQNGSREVIIAFLGSRNLWDDARALFEYGLEQAAPEPVDVQMVRAGERRPATPPASVRAVAAKAEMKAMATRPERAVTKPVATAAARPAPAPVAEGDIEEPAVLRADGRTTHTGHYTVALGPYGNADRAEEARSRLARRGYAPLVSGTTLTLGSFSNRDRASRLASRLREAGYTPSVVALE
jgi:D-alanyl-D-alanine carboxypeptidase (penicillin-binding protein 5/6)